MIKHGFTFIELVVVLLIIGIMGTVLVPYLGGGKQKADMRSFVSQFNELLQGAWRNALQTRHIQKVKVDFKNNVITLTERVEKGATQRDDVFIAVKGLVTPTTITIPDGCTFVNFYIEGKDEMARETRSEDAWFFIMPDGIAQLVVINLKLQVDDQRAGIEIAGLVLNPFTAQFEYYDEWQKP